MLGIRLTDFIYSPRDYYCRLDLIETDLLFKKELIKKERLKLLKENVNFIVNYSRMLDDKDKYLWKNLAEDNQIFISFKTKNAFTNWIKNVENDLRKFGLKEQFLDKVLQFFNKLHWIRIENIKDLSFRIDQAIENTKQLQFLMEYLSQHTKITQNNGVYYIN
jgi:hypothetical protein